MNKEQYVEKLQHAEKLSYDERMSEMGQSSFARDMPFENNISADSPIPYLELGTSFTIGLAVGFFIKKSFKMVLFVLGFALIISFYMESQGIFTINDKVLEESIANGTQYFDYLVSAVKERITSFQSGVGALAGFVVGLKLG